jgi:hypothetical protein
MRSKIKTVSIDSKLGTGGSNQDIPQINSIEHYELLQLDLSLRF